MNKHANPGLKPGATIISPLTGLAKTLLSVGVVAGLVRSDTNAIIEAPAVRAN